MPTSADRLLALILGLALLSTTPHAQTRAQNDKAAADAVKHKGLPLITERTVSFTTSEATWLSLDLSPDGTTIVFELLGDLYTLPITGGQATRITSGQAYDMQPAWSPDGKHLVFISDRNGSENIWIANADGSKPRAITTTERDNYMSPTWTPDGEYVIAAKGAQLWMYNQAGGSGVQMTGAGPRPAAATPGPGPAGPATPAILGPAFGKDPDSLWVNVRGPVRPGLPTRSIDEDESRADFDPHTLRSNPRIVGPYQIAQLDRRTGRLLVRTHEHPGAFRPVPSPDGRWLVYATRHDARQALKLLDLSTGDDRWLRMDVQRDDSQGGGARDRDVYPNSAFTPDSSALITSYDGKLWRIAVPSGEAVEIPFTAKVDQRIGPLVTFDYPIDDERLRVSQIRGARPSPDGTRVVFTALDRLWIADLPQGRGTKKEKAGDADGPGRDRSPSGPSTTPEGEAANGAAAATPPATAPAAAPAVEAPPAPIPTIRNARRLTDGTDVEHGPVWSPDGQFIAYVTWNDEDGGHIRRVRADGSGQPERLTSATAFYDRIAHTKDGSRIIGVRGSKMHRLRTLEDFGNHSGAAELEYVWLPANGGAVTRIAWAGGGSTQEGREAPHVGPDPDRIYVWAGAEGLLSMRYDGTDITTVVKVTAPAPPRPADAPPGPPPTPDEVLLSPDGTRALVRANRNVYMITVPPVSGNAPTVSAASSSSVPTWRLTKVGGDFVGWTADSQRAYFSIGRSVFLHDVAMQAEVDLANRLKGETEAERAAAQAAAAPAPGAPPAPATPADKPAAPPKIPTLEYEPHRVDVEIIVDKDKPTGVIALRNARLITMKGDEVIARGDVVITDNRITAIGPRGTVAIPAGAVVRDLAGKTIMPGLVDIHAHTWVAWGVHRNQVSQFLAQLAFGVTTQRDPQTSSEDALTYQDLMETGQLIGPRLYSTGPGIFSSDNIRSLDDARDALRRYSDHYNTKTIKQYLVGDRKVRQWVIMAAKELGLTPTTEGGSNFTMNLTLMQDGYAGLEHSLPISPFFTDVVGLGAASGITYTPTLIVSYGGPIGRQHYLTNGTSLDADARLRRFTPHEELDSWRNTDWHRADQYVFPLHAKQLAKWVAGGGKVGLGSHGEVQGVGVHWELWMMASGGLTPHAALRAATLDGARAIGFGKDLGSLEVGKLADLLVLEANPLDDIRNTTRIAQVMKNGRLHDAATLDETYPRQKPLGPQWWWKLEPPAPATTAPPAPAAAKPRRK
ncbi:amidohydrolase family protein [Luteitalea sp.]|uniref:amidohydrolase family protein n=1 Tax=Luteitalea sp. TaxID=2004800 RepID=UPI0025C41D1E|nr:amidohydrolase family protein [Luteitalea sp.]